MFLVFILFAGAGVAGINGRSSFLDPFRSAFRVVLGRFERGVHARSDEWVLRSFFLSLVGLPTGITRWVHLGKKSI